MIISSLSYFLHINWLNPVFQVFKIHKYLHISKSLMVNLIKILNANKIAGYVLI